MNAARTRIKFVFWGILINSYLINSGAAKMLCYYQEHNPDFTQGVPLFDCLRLVYTLQTDNN